MPLTSFVGSLRPKVRLRPLADSFNTSVMSQQLKAMDACERLSLYSTESISSTTTSSTSDPMSQMSTAFGPSTSSSADSVMTFDTDITDPDDSTPPEDSSTTPTNSECGDDDWAAPSSSQPRGNDTLMVDRRTIIGPSWSRRKRRDFMKKRTSYKDSITMTRVSSEYHQDTFLKTQDDLDSSSDSTLCGRNSRPRRPKLLDEPTTESMLIDGRLSGDDFFFDRQCSDNGALFLKMFLKEKWEAQAETCRISGDVTLHALIDMGKQPGRDGVRRCRNLIHCPGLGDEIAISLWSLLSDSVPAPDDFLQDDDDARSVASLQFVERFIVPRGEDRRSSAGTMPLLQHVGVVPQKSPERPIMSGRRASWVPGDASPRQGQAGSVPADTNRPPLHRSKSTAHLGGWARRQRHKISVAGEAIGRGYGNTYDEATLRIFLLKAAGHMGLSPQDGVAMMRSYRME